MCCLTYSFFKAPTVPPSASFPRVSARPAACGTIRRIRKGIKNGRFRGPSRQSRTKSARIFPRSRKEKCVHPIHIIIIIGAPRMVSRGCNTHSSIPREPVVSIRELTPGIPMLSFPMRSLVILITMNYHTGELVRYPWGQ